MIAILVGLVFLGLGFWGLVCWFQDFLVVARGIVPISLVLGGLMAFLAGIGSLRARRGDDSKKD